MTRVFIWKNNSPQEREEISFPTFSKARHNGCLTGRFFAETVKILRDEDDCIIMECSRKDFEKYQQEDRHSRYLQEHEKSRSIFPISHVGDCNGTKKGYQDIDSFVDESVDTAEQAICNLLMADLHRALQRLSQKERSFILDYYNMEKPSTLQLAKRYGVSQSAAHKRLKKIEEKTKKLAIDFQKKWQQQVRGKSFHLYLDNPIYEPLSLILFGCNSRYINGIFSESCHSHNRPTHFCCIDEFAVYQKYIRLEYIGWHPVMA